MTDIDIDKCAADARAACTNASLVMPWADLGESSKEYYRGCARAVLESAGVERLRKELSNAVERANSLYAQLDEWRGDNEKHRNALRCVRAELAEMGTGNTRDEDLHEAVRALKKSRDEQKARADRAEGQRNWAADRIAALEKVVRSAANLLDGTDAVTLYPTGFVACAFNELRAALDSAQPAPDAGITRDGIAAAENTARLFEPAPDARDERTFAGLTHAEREQLKQDYERLQAELSLRSERIRAFQSAARTVPEDTVRLSERLDAANERIRELEHLIDLQRRKIGALEGELEKERADAKHLEEKTAHWFEESRTLWDRIRSLESDVELRDERIRELEADRDNYRNAASYEGGRATVLSERIRVACAELRKLGEGYNRIGHSSFHVLRIARALEGKDSGQPGESRDATGTVRAGSDSESRAGVFQESPSDIDPDAAEHRTWILEQHARMESRADIRTLCIIAAQYETTQPQMQPLSEKLNGAERNAGPEYAIELVERMRERIGR